jgi:hypothetical protein
VPSAAELTAANANDITTLPALIDGIPPLRGKRGCPRFRPDSVLGDRAYDFQPHRRAVRARQIVPILARGDQDHGSGLGGHRRVVEWTLSWFVVASVSPSSDSL